jgi:hypothetical protein
MSAHEGERLELLREQQRRVESQLAELEECLRVITRKVGVYEQQVADDGEPKLLPSEA